MSSTEITIWLEAKEKIDYYTIKPRETKDIGWAQGFRFDANDAFFLWADGHDTLRQMMPSDELSDWRLRFAVGGGLILNLSQSFVQNRLQNEIKLPVELSYSKIVRASIEDYPNVIFQDGSNRCFADVPVRTSWLGSSAKILIKTRFSFVPAYDPSSGKVFATDLQIYGIDINLVPKEWLNDFKIVINQLLVVLFKPVVVFQLDKSLLKYARFFKVRNVVVRDGRLDIIFL